MKPRFSVVLAAAALLSATAALAQVPGAFTAGADYRLKLGDKLRIEVHKDPQMSQSVQIRPDGKITLPLVGDIEATGRTPIELRDQITRQLTEYIARPVVTVIVVEATAPVVYVVGEVVHPGAVTLPDENLGVLQAIAMAGGLKDFADRKHIRLLRKGVAGNNVIKFDYKAAIEGRAPVFLRPGDTIVVPD